MDGLCLVLTTFLRAGVAATVALFHRVDEQVGPNVMTESIVSDAHLT